MDLWSDIIAMDYPSPHILRLYKALFRIKDSKHLVKHLMFTVLVFYILELYTGEGCVEMDNPWQLCRTIGTLALHSQEINSFSSN